MHLKLHKNARTTPAIRAELQAATGSHEALAERYGISISTVRKWRKRTDVQDRSHTAHRLQTTLSLEQEGLAVELRKTLRLSLDDLLVVVREFLNPSASRSGLDRCLRRHGVGSLQGLEPEVPSQPPKTFKAYEPGFVHMDVKYLPQMPDETSRRYLFVAIDRATRWVYVAIKPRKTASAAQSFLKALHKAAPFRIHRLLTDNGSEFTDRLFNKTGAPSGDHEFDQLCADLGIEHRLTRPRTPQTNGMVERFNGRISEVLATNRFVSGEDLSETIERYVWLYNHHLPQLALQHRTPILALKDWQKTNPELFLKAVYNRPGCDTYASCRSSDGAGGIRGRWLGKTSLLHWHAMLNT